MKRRATVALCLAGLLLLGACSPQWGAEVERTYNYVHSDDLRFSYGIPQADP